MPTKNPAAWLSFKSSRIIPALLMFGLGQASPASATSFADLTLVYDARFDGGSLVNAIDPMGYGQLKLGHAQVVGANPTWTLNGGDLQLGVTQPVGYAGIVSSGAFVTPVNFAAGSVFGMRATFLAPTGPHATGNIWAIVLGARTGDEDDFFAETRAAASLRIRGGGAHLNSPGSSVPAGLPNLPQDVYDAIFDPVDPHPFTLELVVDRINGAGNATLRVDNSVFSHDFQFAAFRADSGPAITAVGPSLAISTAQGQSASVRVLGFQIFTPAAAVPETSVWMMFILGFGMIGRAMRGKQRLPSSCGWRLVQVPK